MSLPRGVQRPHKSFARFWYITYGLCAFLTLPIEWVFPAWPAVAAHLALAGFSAFLGAESVAGGVPEGYDGTKTEFTYWKVSEPWVRFILGVWMALVVWWRLPDPVDAWIGIPLLVWLPVHLTWWQIELRAYRWIKERINA